MAVTKTDRRKAAQIAKQYRRGRRLSQTKLAAQLDTHQRFISEAERAYPSVPAEIVRAILQLAA